MSRAILREGFVCDVAHCDTSGSTPLPKSVPMVYAFDEKDELLYLHGSPNSLRHLLSDTGVPVCLTVTLVDGIVLGRTAIHHSLNYRSVVVDGTATKVKHEDRMKALEVLTNHVVPGRWKETRPLRAEELDADEQKGRPGTEVLSIDLRKSTVASKHHAGGPTYEEKEDVENSAYWAGEFPIRPAYGPPVPVDNLSPAA
ncbi:pyridoxamine 5'-phosphate oxidase family protein, partial [Streptomyces hainanensis]|uniref:pyridoxamine 5'-phosphate oxidase family protein n=1 Tax=Streptomyces hainanensis TaxID=402648 RepID=UPI001404F567